MVVTASLFYNIFRKLLIENLRPYEEAIHVSEVTHCLRKSYYSRKYGDMKTLSHLSDTKCVILGLGVATHLTILRELQNYGFVIEPEVRYLIESGDEKFYLVGRPDAVGEDTVIELKTVSRIPDAPYEHHVLQLQAYLNMLNYSVGYLVYISKTDGRIQIFDMNRSESIFKIIKERAVRLWNAIKKQELPEAERDYLCRYCEFWSKCYADEN